MRSSSRLPEEFVIYQYLDDLKVHPIDLNNYLSETRIFAKSKKVAIQQIKSGLTPVPQEITPHCS